MGHRLSQPGLHAVAVRAGAGVALAATLVTHRVLWSYAGITVGPDGLLYVTNEASGIEINGSVFTVDAARRTRKVFARNLATPEGLRFAAKGGFPLYVAEENIGSDTGRLSRVAADGTHRPFGTGFYTIEGVALDENGRLFVSEDATGWVIVIEGNWRVWLPLVLHFVLFPLHSFSTREALC